MSNTALVVVAAVLVVDMVIFLALIVLKTVHRARVERREKRRRDYLALLSHHLTFENSVEPIPELAGDDEAFLDAIIDMRNTVTGVDEKLSEIANRFDLIDRQIAGLRGGFPLTRRLRAAVSLAELGDGTSAGVLIEHLEDPEDEIRIQAARGLARIGHTPAIDYIVDRLDKETPWVRARFGDSLATFGSVATQPLMAYVRVNHNQGDTPAVVQAIRTLELVGDHEVGPQLAEVLDLSSNPEIKIAAVSALGAVGGELTLLSVIDALHSEEWRIRARAAASLGQIGDVSAIRQLKVALSDHSWWVRRNAAAALASLPGGVPELYDALLATDPFSRDAAAEALEDKGELTKAREKHNLGTAGHDELRLLRHMRGAEVVPA